MKTLLLSLCAPLLLASVAVAAPGDGLGVGMPAPALDHVTWLKGDKIAAWQPGQIYVLDFWATWCGPCKASIPHVNEMAKQYGKDGVNVIGVAIWPRKGMVPTDEFVAEKGEAMDYLIAEDVDGATAKAFMEPARCDGIPTMMVVDRKGEIAWIGHPMKLGETLAQIVAGTDDRAAAVAADAARREQGDLDAQVMDALQNYPALDAAGAAKVLEICEKQLAADPKNPQLAYNKYLVLVKAGPKEAASAFGNEIITNQLKDIPRALHLMAWVMIDPLSNIPAADRDLHLALAAATRADELTEHGDPSVLDTLARLNFNTGHVDKAIELQKKAIELTPDAEQKAQLQTALDEYEKASTASPAGG